MAETIQFKIHSPSAVFKAKTIANLPLLFSEGNQLLLLAQLVFPDFFFSFFSHLFLWDAADRGRNKAQLPDFPSNCGDVCVAGVYPDANIHYLKAKTSKQHPESICMRACEGGGAGAEETSR